MLELATKETLTEIAIERLTADIVNGVLPPDRKLQIAELCKHYQMGASPLREGLARLSSLGFVQSDSRRGFRVAPMSKADLEDLTAIRCAIEVLALRRAIQLGDAEWEVGVVAAYARLQRLVARHDAGESAGDSETERAHRLFHTSLVAACGSPRMLQMHSVLYDQAHRYRQLMLEHVHDLQGLLATHEVLLQAVLSRDADAACTMLTEHLSFTLREVYPASDTPGRRMRMSKQRLQGPGNLQKPKTVNGASRAAATRAARRPA